MRKFIFGVTVFLFVVGVLNPCLGLAGTRYALVEFSYEGNSYYTPRDYCMILSYTNPDSVLASGRILERNGTYFFEFEITDGGDFGPGTVANYVKIWAYTDSIYESRYITPLLSNQRELQIRFYFGADPQCYAVGVAGTPGGP